MTFIEPTKYVSSSDFQTQKTEKSDSTLRFKPLPKKKKNGQGNRPPTRTEKNNVSAMKKDTADDSTSSDINNSDLIILPHLDAPNPLSIHNLSMTRCQDDATSIENMQNNSDIMVSKLIYYWMIVIYSWDISAVHISSFEIRIQNFSISSGNDFYIYIQIDNMTGI